MSRTFALTCPYCSASSYYKESADEKYVCVGCEEQFQYIPLMTEDFPDPIAEAEPGRIKHKPFRRMPERTQEETEAYHRGEIMKGLKLIQIWLEDGAPYGDQPHEVGTNIQTDMSRAADYLQAFNALAINTASLAWVYGMIEFIGDVQRKYQECETQGEKRLFTDWLWQTLADRKQANYEVLATLKDNVSILESYLNTATDETTMGDSQN